VGGKGRAKKVKSREKEGGETNTNAHYGRTPKKKERASAEGFVEKKDFPRRGSRGGPGKQFGQRLGGDREGGGLRKRGGGES